jgi:hypothetical protein
MKELVFIVYSLTYFNNTCQEKYYLVNREQDGNCFIVLNKEEVNYYYSKGAVIDTQRVYTAPFISVK